MPEFKPLMESCDSYFQDISLQIMAAMELGLDLDKGTLVDR